MLFLSIIFFIVLILLILYMLSPLIAPKEMTVNGRHVLITGGSSGIGKAVAVELAQRGAQITLLARNELRLSEAKQYIENYLRDKDKQRVVCISIDLTKDYNAIEKAIQQATDMLGPVSILINCAGYAAIGAFQDLPIEAFRKQLEVNYLGCVYATRAVIGQMKANQEGRVVLVSSQAGQIGVFGYTAYCPSKFALRGFAEALQMEVLPYNIRVTLVFPPDTDTPGYTQENLGKPRETKLISESSGLFQPQYVAKCLINDCIKGKFNSPIGLDGWMLGHLTSGMSPVTSLTEAIQQICLMGVFRAIALFYLSSFNKIVTKCANEKRQKPAS